MFRHNLAVKWENGDVSGFSGFDIANADRARDDAIANAEFDSMRRNMSFVVVTEFAFPERLYQKLVAEWSEFEPHL